MFAQSSSGWGRGRRGIALLVAVAVILGTGVAAAVFVPRRVEHDIDGGGTISIRLPWSAGTPATETLPALAPADLPLATLPVTRPVRIEAVPLLRQAELTFSYEGLALPAGIDPVEDLVVLTLVPELGVWLPVATTVDPAAATAAVATPHFSEWVLGVTDPEVLQNEKALAERLQRSAGGALARIVYGEQSPLGCDPASPLLPVTIRDPVALGPKVCQEQRADGRYALSYVNTSGMPRLLTLPPGFSRDDAAFVRGTNQVFADALATRHPGTAVVMDGEAITLTFADADVAPDTRITGTTDWGIYLLSIVRLMGGALLLGEKDQDKAAEVLDGVLLAGKLWDCLDKFSDEILGSRNVVQAALGAIEKCAGEAYDAITTVVRQLTGGLIDAAKFLGARFRALLDVSDLMELARAEMNGLMHAMARGFGADTSLTIDPARVMTRDEARALPLTPYRAPDDPVAVGCRTLPVGAVLPGTPQGACVEVVQADLDGNGAPDRLVLWRPPRDELGGDEDALALVGAATFLDDGTFHALADPPSTWPASDLGSVDHFSAARPLRMGEDAREQVLVTVAVGANTTHHVALAVGADRRLRTVTGESAPGPAPFAEGGGAGYLSAFGCVTSQGRPLLAIVGSITLWGGDGGPTRYGWTRTFERLDDTVLRNVGREGGVATDLRAPPAGGDCTAADGAARGPEIGVPGRAAASSEQAAAEFLAAVLNGDRSGVSRLLAGTGVERSWAGGPGSDAWVEARRATQADPASWRSAQLRCGEPERGGDGATYRNCVYERAGTDLGLYLRLRGTAAGWTVSGALGARSTG
jgi:hypothetical protein